MIPIDEAIEFCKDVATDEAFSNKAYGILKAKKLADIAVYLEHYKMLLAKPDKITKLYAIEDIATGQIIFNARGGAYKSADEVLAILDKLEDGKYRIVTYELRK